MSASIVLAILVSLVVLAMASIRRIPEGKVYSLRRIGGQTRLLGAGTHFTLPLIERVLHKISLTGSSVEMQGAMGTGESYNASLYFQVLDPQRAEQVIESVDNMLRERATHLLASAATPVDLAERRQWLKQNLNAEMRERGLLVTRVDLRAAA